MKKSPKKPAPHAPRTVSARALQTIKGGDGGASPGVDLGQMQQMMDRMNAQ